MIRPRIRTLTTGAIAAALALAGSGAPAGAVPLPAQSSPGTAPPRLLMPGSAQVGSGVEYHGRLYFSATTPATGDELWATDGTAAGTRVVKELVPGGGSSTPGNLVVFKGRLFFTATTPDTGFEWFSTDGTSAGTTLLTDIAPAGQGSNPGPAVVAAGLLWFGAGDPTFGRELWSTDGTAGGTIRLADLDPGTAGSDPHSFTSLGDRVVFAAEDEKGATKPFVARPGAGVTRIDNWDVVTDLDPHGFTALGSRAFFVAGHPRAHGDELWVSNGTTSDGQEVRDIYPGTTSAAPEELTAVGGRVWFRATSPDTGTELWTSDGRPAGTTLVRDLRAGATGSGPVNLRGLGDLLLFNADDGQHGTELWATSTQDPSDSHPVLDVLPGTGSGTLATRDPLITSVAGMSLFSGLDAAGLEPWVTDGTSAGTHRVGDLVAGPASSAPYAVGVVGDVVVLGASVGQAGLYAWSPTWTTTTVSTPTAVTSTTAVHAKGHYSAAKARRKRVTVRVAVTSSQGGSLGGGTVTVTSQGRAVGTAPLVDGAALVRLSVRLRPGRQYAVSATWSGTAAVAGSTSPLVRIRIRSRPR
jgi:ELWxxDGT repeat protein